MLRDSYNNYHERDRDAEDEHQNVQVVNGAQFGTLSGTNQTTLSWDANPEANLAKYEVVMRETTAADWTGVINVGNVTSVTLDISKDNVQAADR